MVSQRTRRAVSRAGLLLALALLLLGIAYGTWRVRQARAPRVIELPRELCGLSSFEAPARGDALFVVGGPPWNLPCTTATLHLATGHADVLATSNLMGGWAVSDDGELVAYGTSRGPVLGKSSIGEPDTVLLWSLRDARPIASFSVPSLMGISFTPDGRTLVEGRSGGSDPVGDAIEYPDLASGRITRRLTVPGHGHWVTRLGRDSLLVYVPGYKDKAEVRSLTTGEVVEANVPLEGATPVSSEHVPLLVAHRQVGQHFDVGVWSLDAHQWIRTVHPGLQRAGGAALSTEGDLLAVASDDKQGHSRVDLFSVETGASLATWKIDEKPDDFVQALAFVPGEDTLAIGTNSGRIELHPFRR